MVKNTPSSAGDVGSVPGSGGFPGGGHGNPLQYSCPGNTMDRGAWQVTYSLSSLKESDTTEGTEKIPGKMHLGRSYLLNICIK